MRYWDMLSDSEEHRSLARGIASADDHDLLVAATVDEAHTAPNLRDGFISIEGHRHAMARRQRADARV
jgi:hypothetical protein